MSGPSTSTVPSHWLGLSLESVRSAWNWGRPWKGYRLKALSSALLTARWWGLSPRGILVMCPVPATVCPSWCSDPFCACRDQQFQSTEGLSPWEETQKGKVSEMSYSPHHCWFEGQSWFSSSHSAICPKFCAFSCHLSESQSWERGGPGNPTLPWLGLLHFSFSFKIL